MVWVTELDDPKRSFSATKGANAIIFFDVIFCDMLLDLQYNGSQWDLSPTFLSAATVKMTRMCNFEAEISSTRKIQGVSAAVRWH